ncbi:MAG TPA: hypothetical protein PKL83_00340 [bacterium]|nr:hypothetical protein [bacterium]
MSDFDSRDDTVLIARDELIALLRGQASLCHSTVSASDFHAESVPQTGYSDHSFFLHAGGSEGHIDRPYHAYPWGASLVSCRDLDKTTNEECLRVAMIEWLSNAGKWFYHYIVAEKFIPYTNRERSLDCACQITRIAEEIRGLYLAIYPDNSLRWQLIVHEAYNALLTSSDSENVVLHDAMEYKRTLHGWFRELLKNKK